MLKKPLPKYKPDVVGRDAAGRPRCWGEAGKVGATKIASLARRFRHTHFAKWGLDLAPPLALVHKALSGLDRAAPFDLLSFPPDSADRFNDARSHDNITWVRLG